MKFTKLVVERLLARNVVNPIVAIFGKRNISASVSNDKEDLIVNYGDKQEHFPLVWLRDNCTCKNCFHEYTAARLTRCLDLKIDVKVKSVVTTHNKSVTLRWEDDHTSTFAFAWLQERSFEENSRKRFLNAFYKPEKIPWNDRDFDRIAKRYDYGEIMNNDESLYKCLLNLAAYGVIFIDNTPLVEDDYVKFANRISYVKKTHYGEFFHVVTRSDAKNIAYHHEHRLQLHVDTPYFNYMPGTTSLFYLKQTDGEGGESLFADGLYAAEKLRKEHKEHFDVLTSINVNWFDIGEEYGFKYNVMHRDPVIKLDSERNVEAVRFSQPHRDSHFSVNLKCVKPWYRAFKIFTDLIETHKHQSKTKEGVIYVIDNTRLMHGRQPYRDTTQNQRHVMGFHWDWDQIYSKIRLLQSVLKK